MNDRKIITNKHIKDLLSAIAFVVCFMLTLNMLSLFFMPKSDLSDSAVTKYISRCFRGERKNSIDVFFVGDSNAYRAVSPQVMWNQSGVAACVSGKGAQSPQGAYKVLKEMYKTQTPSVVMIETDMFYPSSGGLKKDLTIMARRCKYAFRDFDNSTLNAIGYYFPIVEYHNRWDSIHTHDILGYKGSYKSNLKGFVPDNTVRGYSGGFKYMGTENAKPARISLRYSRTLAKMVALCKSKGSEVVLVSVPSATSWNYARHNEMISLASKNDINYFDMNIDGTVTGFDWTTDTMDEGVHLNTFGAVKVSKCLSSYLSSAFSSVVPDRREDSKYIQWAQTFNQIGNGLNPDYGISSSDGSAKASSAA